MADSAGHYLGVDGGGTKTAFVLVDAAGTTVAETRGPSCYYFAAGIELVEQVLGEGIEKVTALAGIGPDQIAYAFFGLPGFGEVSADIEYLRAIPGRLLGHDRYACDNDMIGGWAGALGGADGINVIAGTGSMAYGQRRGTGHRVGGWSELFGDEGSAYWIAIGSCRRSTDPSWAPRSTRRSWLASRPERRMVTSTGP